MYISQDQTKIIERVNIVKVIELNLMVAIRLQNDQLLLGSTVTQKSILIYTLPINFSRLELTLGIWEALGCCRDVSLH